MSTLTYTTLRPQHARELVALQAITYPFTAPENRYDEEELMLVAQLFPEGTFVVLDGARPIAMGSGLLMDFDFSKPQHRLCDIDGDGRLEKHNPRGMYYYGTEIMVHPDYRRQGIGRRLYELRKGIVRRLGKRGIVAGGVLPGYSRYKDHLSAADYTAQVASGELYDPTLTFQLQNGFELRGVLQDYYDYPPSDNWASLIYWPNPDWKPQPRPRLQPVRRPTYWGAPGYSWLRPAV